MNRKIKLGVLRETKNPPDKRVAIAPKQAVNLLREFPEVELYVQSSDYRCFTNEEYISLGIDVMDDVSHCDCLIGVKEVKISTLIPDKKYIFFAHVAKKQPYNRELLQEILKRKIELLDYEYFTDENARLIAFGRWAGIVGAYNGLRAWGLKTGEFELKKAHECRDLCEMWRGLKEIMIKPCKILVSGGGRVAGGALETLNQLALKEVSPEAFLNDDFEEAVYCRLDPEYYVERRDGTAYRFDDFVQNPEAYQSTFKKFTKHADLFIASHFWDPASPVFMTLEEMQEDDFKIRVIADISCDIDGPIPSTIRASTIADPFYGFNLLEGREVKAFSKEDELTVMAVDNLPGELPRDASEDFSNMLIKRVFPYLFGEDTKSVVERATITRDGSLTETYSYLEKYVKGEE